jgi:hypothetical protein
LPAPTVTCRLRHRAGLARRAVGSLFRWPRNSFNGNVSTRAWRVRPGQMRKRCCERRHQTDFTRKWFAQVRLGVGQWLEKSWSDGPRGRRDVSVGTNPKEESLGKRRYPEIPAPGFSRPSAVGGLTCIPQEFASHTSKAESEPGRRHPDKHLVMGLASTGRIPSIAETAQISRNGRPHHFPAASSVGRGVEKSHQLNGLRGSWPSKGVPGTSLERGIVRGVGAVAA